MRSLVQCETRDVIRGIEQTSLDETRRLNGLIGRAQWALAPTHPPAHSNPTLSLPDGVASPLHMMSDVVFRRQGSIDSGGGPI